MWHGFQATNLHKFILIVSIGIAITANAQMMPFAVWNSSSGGGGGGGGGGIDCVNTTPAIGALCSDGTYYVGTITISGETYKLATTPSNCGYESGGDDSTSPTINFTPTCSGGPDTMVKTLTSFPDTGSLVVDKTNGTLSARSTIKGSTTTTNLMASFPSTPALAYCHYLEFGGKTDWFLPNRSELHMLACHSTTSTNGLPGTSDDVNCSTFGYGSGSNLVPGFMSGNGNYPVVGYAIYHSSTTYSWGGSSNVGEQTLNGSQSGAQTPSTGNAHVRCLRIIN